MRNHDALNAKQDLGFVVIPNASEEAHPASSPGFITIFKLIIARPSKYIFYTFNLMPL